MQHTSGSSNRHPSVGASVARGLVLVTSLTLLTFDAQAASPRVILTPAAGFTLTWDGNDGGFSHPEAGVGPSNNVALASNGTTPFTSSDLGPVLGIPFHRAVNLNDGLYGNSHCWISGGGLDGTSDPNPFAGLKFASSVNVSSIAWSRDNGDTTEGGCAGGTCTDRAVGTYTLQYTTVPAPDAATAETGEAATGWVTVGTIQYLAGTDDANFTSYLRHRFDIAHGGAPIAATGLRLKISNGMMAIDEIEVNPLPDPVPPISTFIDLVPAAGFSIAWDRNEGNFSTPATPALAPLNDASTSRGTVAFGSSQLDFGVHFIRNVNDGLYGNAHSWIPDFSANPDPAPFIGLNFGRVVLLRNIAWSRDNGDVAGDCCGGTLTDRALGVYVLQYTTVPNPGLATPEVCGPTPETGWVTLATINYRADHPTHFNSYLRHRFDLSQGGAAIPATGLRLKVPLNTSDLDELEVNGNLAIEQKMLRITNAPGFTLSWDGNNGDFNNPAVGAAPPANRALATAGTTAFSSSELGAVLSIPFHRAINLNDGLYGNAHSWISANGTGGSSDPDPFVGLSFGEPISITNIAWSRDNGDNVDNCCGGTATDRVLGTYRLQYTTVAAPDATTPDTGEAATGWADLGTVTYASATANFTPYLRHRFDLSAGGGPLEATGLRIKVSDGWTAIDEIEVNTALTPALPPAITLSPAPGYSLTWDGNDGHFFDAGVGAAPPPNRALASQGTTPFTSSDLANGTNFPYHRALSLNDGLYGNSHAWISTNGLGGTADPQPFAGLNFGGTVLLTNVAWSRDNGDNAELIGTDRAVGTYTLQFTTVPEPDATLVDTDIPETGWATLGTVEYRRTEPVFFTPYLRHRFDVSAGGAPIEATGLRLKLSDGQIAIDEIEVNTDAARPQPRLRFTGSGTNAILSWIGGGGLEGATSVTGPWSCIPEALSPYAVPVGSGPIRFYRVRR